MVDSLWIKTTAAAMLVWICFCSSMWSFIMYHFFLHQEVCFYIYLRGEMLTLKIIETIHDDHFPYLELLHVIMYATSAKICLGPQYLNQPRLTKFEDCNDSSFSDAVFFSCLSWKILSSQRMKLLLYWMVQNILI
jgi:hypothetical protein